MRHKVDNLKDMEDSLSKCDETSQLSNWFRTVTEKNLKNQFFKRDPSWFFTWIGEINDRYMDPDSRIKKIIQDNVEDFFESICIMLEGYGDGVNPVEGNKYITEFITLIEVADETAQQDLQEEEEASIEPQGFKLSRLCKPMVVAMANVVVKTEGEDRIESVDSFINVVESFLGFEQFYKSMDPPPNLDTHALYSILQYFCYEKSGKNQHTKSNWCIR